MLSANGMKNLVMNTIIRPGILNELEQISALVALHGGLHHNWISLLPFGRAKGLHNWMVPPSVWFEKLRFRAINIRDQFSLDVRLCGPVLTVEENNLTWPDGLLYNNYRSRSLVIMADGNVYCDCFVDAFVSGHSLNNDYTIGPKFLQTIGEDRYARLTCGHCRFRFACKGLV
jgi:radical SAM protein with 4Fe4S-binding SPASM domain